MCPSASLGHGDTRAAHGFRKILELGHAVVNRQHGFPVMHVHARGKIEILDHRGMDIDEPQFGCPVNSSPLVIRIEAVDHS